VRDFKRKTKAQIKAKRNRQKRKNKQKEDCSSGKVSYWSFEAAVFFKSIFTPTGKVYLCDECQKYHVTSKKRKQKNMNTTTEYQRPEVLDMGNNHYVISFTEPEKPFRISEENFKELDFELRMPFRFKVIDERVVLYSGEQPKKEYVCELIAPGTITPNENYDMKPPLNIQIQQLNYKQQVAEIEIEKLKARLDALETQK
jgi:hypothetical protein